ncbi:hypothetical protein [Wenzhouxiangella marina]|uniref:hypothetical protein n=1 Tax=Wenzhouxiangella marina TaxID=1579979 RepID=UPI000673BD11|nr:hypothetical protein [Wenzhouxiangella marina]MBB6087470.1 hypothetical protein [Wenzhouxiangella marina]
MSRTYDLQGFTLCLDKVVLISAVFEAEQGEGWQFNIRLLGDVRLPIKEPTRASALLERQMLVQALNGRLEAVASEASRTA